MRNLLGAGVLIGATLSGCEARVNEDYRGEVMLSVNGTLLVAESELSSDAVPALAFEAAAPAHGLHILDVDTTGEFPANFTIDVLSPPPSAAMYESEGLPSFAAGYITAVPAEHPSEITFEEVDGAGGFSWCEGPGNTDCYRTIEQCIKGTDECYREEARCVDVPIEGTESTRRVCNDIISQSGDPTIAYPWSKFVGLSTNYFVVYAASDAPAGAARDYLEDPEQGWTMAFAFGEEPITEGYHLIHSRELTEAERGPAEACAEQVENQVISSYNAEHGTDYVTFADPSFELMEAGVAIEDDPDVYGLMIDLYQGLFDAGCPGTGILYERVDPSDSPLQIALGDREAYPVR